MKRISIEIQGLKPFLYNKFNIESVTSLTKVKTGKVGDDPESWKSSFFHNGSDLYVPGNYLFSALKKAAVFTKSGRGSIQNAWVSGVNIEDELIYFNRKIFDDWENMTLKDVTKDSSNPVYVDIRTVVNPTTKGKNVRYRLGLSAGWKLSFSILLDDTLVSVDHARKVIEDCGKFVGLSDARTLGFGRFIVNEFKAKDSKL